MDLNSVCYSTLKLDEPWTLDSYLELDGYAAYSQRVRFRLIPGVW